MLGYPAGHQPPPAPYCLFSMEDASDASKHAGRGSLSRGSWNKCGNLAPKLRDGGSTAAGIIIYELKSKTHFVLDKGCTLLPTPPFKFTILIICIFSYSLWINSGRNCIRFQGLYLFLYVSLIYYYPNSV